MKCKRIELECDVVKYEPGKNLEDGFELFSKVVTNGWIATDNLIKITDNTGAIVCPYIVHRRGKTFINVNDYVVVCEDGVKLVCGEDKIWTRYKQL